MTPREKALELVNKYEKILKLDYDNYYKYDFSHCRKCALISVDEIIKQSMDNEYTEKYWKQVKEEINKL